VCNTQRIVACRVQTENAQHSIKENDMNPNKKTLECVFTQSNEGRFNKGGSGG